MPVLPALAAAGAAPPTPPRLCRCGPAGEGVGLDPMLAYSAGAEINQLQWSSAHPDWVAICFSNVAQILRV